MNEKNRKQTLDSGSLKKKKIGKKNGLKKPEKLQNNVIKV